MQLLLVDDRVDAGPEAAIAGHNPTQQGDHAGNRAQPLLIVVGLNVEPDHLVDLVTQRA